MSQLNASAQRIDICVATYKRPELLRDLLRSITSQDTQALFAYSIIVVDNDACGSAEAIVREFMGKGLTLVYDVEPQQNISLARNRCLRHATGDYIATIDDDEYADTSWLRNLYSTIVSCDADVVHGPVISIFPDSTPSYVRTSPLFTCPSLRTGSTDKYTYCTGNSLFRRRMIEATGTMFDVEFGRTGGEDVVFFNALRRNGCKLVWCNTAKVFERVSPERTTLRWLLKRFFRNGNITYQLDNKNDSIRAQSKVMARSCLRLAKLAGIVPFWVIGAILSGPAEIRAVKLLGEIAFRLGFVARGLNFTCQEYRPK